MKKLKEKFTIARNRKNKSSTKSNATRKKLQLVDVRLRAIPKTNLVKY